MKEIFIVFQNMPENREEMLPRLYPIQLYPENDQEMSSFLQRSWLRIQVGFDEDVNA